VTIYLPESTDLFRQAFDGACERILRREQESVFYELFLILATSLRENPLFRDYILELESKLEQRQQQCDVAVLKTLEGAWQKLWNYCPRLAQRKKLVRIKEIITNPARKVCTIPHREVRLCKDSEGNPYLWIDPSYGDISRDRNPEMYDRQLRWLLENGDEENDSRRKSAFNLLFDPSSHQSSPLYDRIIGCMSRFCCSENIEFDFSIFSSPDLQEFTIPGKNNSEKRKNMRSLAETNAIFCWGRIKLLERCWNGNGALPVLKSWAGRWSSVRETAWQEAVQRCEMEEVFFAKMSLRQKQSSDFRSNLDCFLRCDRQVHCDDYEKYLHSLKNHIHAQLFKIENIKQKAEEDLRLALPGTQKSSFIIDLASKYWKAHPLANRDGVFNDYCIKCPAGRLLSRERWEQIVRKRKLDPRPKEAKKRGPGKKTLQN